MELQVNNPDRLNSLTKREKEILDMLLKGALVKEICQELNLKSNTISTFKKKIFHKTGTSNIIELFQLANNQEKK